LSLATKALVQYNLDRIRNSVNKPHDLGEKSWNWLSDDILYKETIKYANPGTLSLILHP